jgi:hypothetical protein
VRNARATRLIALLATAIAALLVPAGHASAGGATSAARPTSAAAARMPSRADQIKVLTRALARMSQLPLRYVGTEDVFGYGVGALWRRGIDGAGTTIAVIEGWNYPGITRQVAAFDRAYGLPNPRIVTIYPAGKLPRRCPPGMVKLGSYGSCPAWSGELTLDVLAVHLMAPYARIVISATPADTETTDDAASQVAPPEMMKAVEQIARHHLANVISVSDGTGESSYRHGRPEILAQDPGELAAAAAGIPLLVATGDCGVVQTLPAASSQCGDTSAVPDTATWDDSPWVTAVGGSVPVVNSQHQLAGLPKLWRAPCNQNGSATVTCSSAAGFSKVFARPSYQDGVASITGSGMRSVPDITMDGTDGTSEASPLLAGVLALATQENKADLGPINPVLYGTLGPAGMTAGIRDVVGANDSFTLPRGPVVPGFAAAAGFDVASGWGTVSAPAFVPALVSATKGTHEESAARARARSELVRLGRALTVTPAAIRRGTAARLVATGFLPGHPVRIYVAGRYVATRHASAAGTIRFEIIPSRLGLAAGRHAVTLASLLLDERGTFVSR